MKDTQFSFQDGSKINANWVIWVRGSLMSQDLKPSVNPKETSLMTHPDVSMKMYDIRMVNGILGGLRQDK